LFSTDLNSVIGCYCPDKWERTINLETSDGFENCKDIVSGKPFLFYCLENKIEIIEFRDDKIPCMVSDNNWLMLIGGGLAINAYKNEKSYAAAHKNMFVHP